MHKITNECAYQLTRQQRLVEAKDYEYVFAQPCKLTDRYLTILARSNDRVFGRLGLAIAKKRVAKAVDRNRIKRLIRESFRHHQLTLAGWDCVVLVRNGVTQVNNCTLLNSLTWHWQQLPCRCKKS